MNIGISAENIKEAYNHLRSIGKIHTQKDLADLMKSTPSNISKALNGDPRFLTENFLMRFNRAFDGIFNEDWLLGNDIHIPMLRRRIDIIPIQVFYREEDQRIQTDGDYGLMLQRGYELLCKTTYPEWDGFSPKIRNIRTKTTDPISYQAMKELWLDYYYYSSIGEGKTWEPPMDILNNNDITIVEELTPSNSQLIANNQVVATDDFVPILPVEAMAGSLQGYSEGVALRDCRKIKSPVQGADWAIQISGDSMEPDYKNGSYLFIKKMSGGFIPWGQTLVVDTLDGVVVKDIYPIDGTDAVIEARSKNTKYPPFRIDTSCILGMYRVLGGSFINSTI